MPLGLPKDSAQDHSCGLQLSTASRCHSQRRPTQPSSQGRSSRAPPHAVQLALRCDYLMSKWPQLRLTKYVDDFTICYRGMNHTVATVITEAVSSVVGWLENGLNFHVSKDEEGVEGKSVVLVSNASLKAALTSSTRALGMPIWLPVQRRILRAEMWALWQAIILSEPGTTFVSDCATVLSGLERGPKWCTAARRPHADVWGQIWDCFQDIGKPSWTRRAASRPLATNGQMSWPKKERVMTPSSPSCATRTMQRSKRVRPSSATLGTSSSEPKEEKDGARCGHAASRMGREG